MVGSHICLFCRSDGRNSTESLCSAAREILSLTEEDLPGAWAELFLYRQSQSVYEKIIIFLHFEQRVSHTIR